MNYKLFIRATMRFKAFALNFRHYYTQNFFDMIQSYVRALLDLNFCLIYNIIKHLKLPLINSLKGNNWSCKQLYEQGLILRLHINLVERIF